MFRNEDEMYKVDHEIENNFRTMKLLEKEKAYIDSLSAQDKESYKLDLRKFNTLKLKWIEKTYAEMG